MNAQTTDSAPVPPTPGDSELLAIRRSKLEKLKELGHEPFGGRYDTTHSPGGLQGAFEEGLSVRVAGRVSARRDMGKTLFFDVSDINGRMQCFLNAKNVPEEVFALFRDLIDLGDWLGVEGETFITKTGEPSIKVSGLTVLSKALRPMPDKWHGVADREIKYRQRYLDLMSNARSREVFLMRSRILAEIRRYLGDRDYLEVETPMLQGVAGGAAARPFETFHNALGQPFYLRIAPELYLKRLLVGGFTKVFELNRNFRNEGISRRHNPEFTMLEAYQAYGDFEVMADMVEDMVCHLAEKFCGTLKVEHKDEEGNVVRTIDLSRPWKRTPYRELLSSVDAQWWDYTPEQRREKCAELGVEISPGMEDYEVTQQVFEKKIEEKTFDPCFVTHVPTELVPLAKQNRADGRIVDVYELIINGVEVSPGYSELNDPQVQRARLMDQAGEETQNIDEEFLLALEHGMPPAGGIGIGIDRLVMLLTGSESIRDVVLFPQLKNRE
ncbi:MAG: lysine--tRNA ligase [Verrucomicrobiota bacterium]